MSEFESLGKQNDLQDGLDFHIYDFYLIIIASIAN